MRNGMVTGVGEASEDGSGDGGKARTKIGFCLGSLAPSVRRQHNGSEFASEEREGGLENI